MKVMGRTGLAPVFMLMIGLAAMCAPAKAADAGLTPSARSELEALLAASTGETRFTPPGPPVDPSSLKAKLIFTIPTSTTIPFCDVVNKQMMNSPRSWASAMRSGRARRRSGSGFRASTPPSPTRPI